MQHRAQVFVDGAHLRAISKDTGKKLVSPRALAGVIVGRSDVQGLLGWPQNLETGITRVTYYDALTVEETENKVSEDDERNLREYWDTVEKLPQTHLGFGTVRRGRRGEKRQQKGVDTLMAVEMVAGAFTGIFDMAVLIAGDADFVPVLEEVGRRGVTAVVAGGLYNSSDALVRVADLFVGIGPQTDVPWPALGPWYADAATTANPPAS